MLVEFRSRFPFEHVPPAGDPALDAMAARWADQSHGFPLLPRKARHFCSPRPALVFGGKGIPRKIRETDSSSWISQTPTTPPSPCFSRPLYPTLSNSGKPWLGADLLGLDPARLDRRADREDWAENAVQLLAAAEAGLPVAAVAPGRRPGPQDAFRPEAFGSASPEEKRFLNGAETSSPGPHALKIGFGGRGDGDPVWPDADSAAAVARYARNPGFSAVAGRFARTAHVPGEGNAGDVVSSDDPKSLRSVVRQALRTSRRDPAELLVKIVSSAKYAPLEGFTLSKDASDLEIDGALLSALGYGLVHLEGSRDAVLVQERVDMRHEYRLVVVDGSPVAGAGCVEAFCPLDRTSDSGRFESRMEGARGDGDVEPRDEVLARYLSDAPDIVARLRKEDPGLKDFVLDLATGANGRTLVVEINPPWNFGLYAMDFALVLAAAVEASKARTRNPRQSGGDAR